MGGTVLKPAPLGNVRRFVPASHWLFSVFPGQPEALRAAARVVMATVVSDEDIWLFHGEEGARRLDPNEVQGAGARLWLRPLVWVFSLNVEYLRMLAEEVRSGSTVIAIAVKDQRSADEVAAVLALMGGSGFAYTTHWNFVPVALST
jgi:hypothetical protein